MCTYHFVVEDFVVILIMTLYFVAAVVAVIKVLAAVLVMVF